MAVDLGVFERQKTIVDQQQLQDAFDLKRALVLGQLERMQGGGLNTPSSVREWQFYNQIPEDQRENYMRLKRADQVINLGGQQGVRNPVTGQIEQVYQVTPKPEQMPDFKGRQRAAELEQDLKTKPQIKLKEAESQIIGKDIGTTKANIGDIEQNAQTILNTLGQLEKSPGMSAVVGWPNPLKGGLGFLGNVPASRAADFQAKLDQLGGQQFLQAYESLRGGGQITEVEGTKATNAIASMQTAQSEEQFLKSLNEFKGIVQRGLQRARQKAGVTATPNFNPNAIPPKAVELLKQNPNARDYFDQKYGDGAATYFLGQ
jgi:hypothetical protein